MSEQTEPNQRRRIQVILVLAVIVIVAAILFLTIIFPVARWVFAGIILFIGLLVAWEGYHAPKRRKTILKVLAANPGQPLSAMEIMELSSSFGRALHFNTYIDLYRLADEGLVARVERLRDNPISPEYRIKYLYHLTEAGISATNALAKPNR